MLLKAYSHLPLDYLATADSASTYTLPQSTSTYTHKTHTVFAASFCHFFLSFCSPPASDPPIQSPIDVFLLPFYHCSALAPPPWTSLSHQESHPSIEKIRNPLLDHAVGTEQTSALGSSMSCLSPLCISIHNCIPSAILGRSDRNCLNSTSNFAAVWSTLDFKLFSPINFTRTEQIWANFTN